LHVFDAHEAVNALFNLLFDVADVLVDKPKQGFEPDVRGEFLL
jgi:hypothetical protein